MGLKCKIDKDPQKLNIIKINHSFNKYANELTEHTVLRRRYTYEY